MIKLRIVKNSTVRKLECKLSFKTVAIEVPPYTHLL